VQHRRLDRVLEVGHDRRRQLLDQVWGPSWIGDEHVVDVHLSNLRRKLGDDPRDPVYIRTVRGFGFRFGGV